MSLSAPLSIMWISGVDTEAGGPASTSEGSRPAANAGVASVAVSYGAHPADELARHAPLFVAQSTRELHHWLCEHA